LANGDIKLRKINEITRRNARPCAGHLRLDFRKAIKAWMAGTSPAMTKRMLE
jgi:hypothetical protein